ncbi:hypothetical protein [Methylobacterium fujisawaense]|uniref:hypothetical protein n=1 Tax=Methylobacterium fujisawaense TaxID=107400 RepID=UPI00313CF2A1
MRNIILSGALFAALCGAASAEETTVIRRDGPAVVDHRDTVVEKREVATGTVDCGSKTVHKEDGMGNSKTVHKEGCN